VTSPEDGGTGAGGAEDVGSVAEEAAKLFGALSGWARDNGSGLGHGFASAAEHAATTARDAGEHIATGAPECSYCPICRTVHAVRQTSPEVRAHLAVAASSLMQAAAGLLATTVPEQHRGSAEDGVEHIDLDEGAWPEDEQ
jgi:hypothetical protein